MTLSSASTQRPSATKSSAAFSKHHNKSRKSAASAALTGSVAGGGGGASTASCHHGSPPPPVSEGVVAIASSSLTRPSFAAGRAQQARDTAYKQLQHNISLLSSRRLQLQRVMASCFREANTVATVAERAKDHRRMVVAALDGNREQMTRLSLVASSVAAAGGSRSASFSQHRHNHHYRDPSGSSSRNAEDDEKPPFSLYRRHQQALPFSSNSGCSTQRMRRDPSSSVSPNSVQTLATHVLSHRESATIFEHMALLQSLAERIDRGVADAMVIHDDMVHSRLKGQHMLNLLDRAIDAEVQVLHGAFPLGSPAANPRARSRSGTNNTGGGVQQGSSDNERQRRATATAAAEDETVVFVNASPLFPNLTISDFPEVEASMSALVIKGSETLKDLRRCMDEGSYRVNESTSDLHRQLERGVKVAHTKHAEAVLFHAAAVNEEKKHLAKRSGLLAELEKLQRRMEGVDRTLKLRSTLGVSSPPSSRHPPNIADSNNRSRSRSKSPNNNGSNFRGASASPTSTDVVASTLMDERMQLQTQLDEVVQKIAKLDVVLKRVSLEKHHHHEDVDASAMRSVTCAALSPSRSRSPAAA